MHLEMFHKMTKIAPSGIFTKMLECELSATAIILYLLSISDKILVKLILNFIYSELRSGWGTKDMIFSLSQVAKKIRGRNFGIH